MILSIIAISNFIWNVEIKGVDDVYHIHLWSMDGYNNYATMHVVTKSNNVKELKQKI